MKRILRKKKDTLVFEFLQDEQSPRDADFDQIVFAVREARMNPAKSKVVLTFERMGFLPLRSMGNIIRLCKELRQEGYKVGIVRLPSEARDVYREFLGNIGISYADHIANLWVTEAPNRLREMVAAVVAGKEARAAANANAAANAAKAAVARGKTTTAVSPAGHTTVATSAVKTAKSNGVKGVPALSAARVTPERGGGGNGRIGAPITTKASEHKPVIRDPANRAVTVRKPVASRQLMSAGRRGSKAVGGLARRVQVARGKPAGKAGKRSPSLRSLSRRRAASVARKSQVSKKPVRAKKRAS
ncbi:MAG: hypothetical protein HY719_07180 [Planctomycetes bacterium]|nr:hypothetical protein [Planctomycetota bacterium]